MRAILTLLILTLAVNINAHPSHGRFARQAEEAVEEVAEKVMEEDEVVEEPEMMEKVAEKVMEKVDEDVMEKVMEEPEYEMEMEEDKVEVVEDPTENEVSMEKDSKDEMPEVNEVKNDEVVVKQSVVTTTTTTTTTTRRTTTTTRRPDPPADPGFLGRIGNFVNQGVGSIGGNIVSGSTLLMAAASPLWAPLLVAGKKRKRRADVSSNEIHDTKPMHHYVKMIMSHIEQARETYDKSQ